MNTFLKEIICDEDNQASSNRVGKLILVFSAIFFGFIGFMVKPGAQSYAMQLVTAFLVAATGVSAVGQAKTATVKAARANATASPTTAAPSPTNPPP